MWFLEEDFVQEVVQRVLIHPWFLSQTSMLPRPAMERNEWLFYLTNHYHHHLPSTTTSRKSSIYPVGCECSITLLPSTSPSPHSLESQGEQPLIRAARHPSLPLGWTFAESLRRNQENKPWDPCNILVSKGQFLDGPVLSMRGWSAI